MMLENIGSEFLSSDKTVRANASRKLAGLGKDGVTFVIPYLTSSNWIFRYRACEVIGLTHLSQYAPLLIPSLADEKDHVRYMAVKSLGLLANPAEYTDKIRPLLRDENPFVVRMATKVLATWHQNL